MKVIIILLLAIVSLIAVLKFQNLPQVQFSIVSILVLIYLIWAFLHHHIDKSLKLEIMVEYILTALLSMVVLYGVLI